MFPTFCGTRCREKRGDESKNYSPPIPPTRIPFLLIPDLFYVRFLEFSVFQFFGLLDPYWTPIGPLLVHAKPPDTFEHSGTLLSPRNIYVHVVLVTLGAYGVQWGPMGSKKLKKLCKK